MDDLPKPQIDPSQTPNQPEATPVVKAPSMWRKLSLIIAGVVLVVAVGVLGWLQLNKNEAPAAEVKHDIPVIKYGLEGGPVNTFYPGNSFAIGEFHVNEQVFEGLVRFDKGTQIVPLLAESWTNPDASTWIFNLKKGVKFHTGREMRAADVEYSLENFKDSEFGSVFNTTIKNVEVTGDYQVKITTDGPDPLLLHRLAFLFIVDPKSKQQNSDMNGTGPYMVKPGTKPDANHLDLVAFDDYHGGHIYTRELQIQVIDNEAKMVKELTDHKINMGAFGFTKNIADLKNQGYTPFEVQDVSVWSLGLNHKSAPLKNLKVRQAIYRGIDTAALIAASGQPGQEVSQYLLPEIPGYDPSIKRLTYDPTAAKDLLKEAGYPSGFAMDLDFYAPRKPAVENIAVQLKKIGITVNLHSYDEAGELFGKVTDGNSQSWWYAPGSDLLDASDVASQALQTTSYSNPKVDELLTKANQTFDSAQRLDLLKQVTKIATDDLAIIPLYYSTTTYMLDQPYQMHIDVLGYLGVYFWQVYTK